MELEVLVLLNIKLWDFILVVDMYIRQNGERDEQTAYLIKI